MRSAAIVLAGVMGWAAFAMGQSTPAAPTVNYVTAQPGVRLEVLDWGGPPAHGPRTALIFLAGLGQTAHVFDDFAPRFTGQYHVYGITRRGFGASSQPAPTVANYSAGRLGMDVLAVMAALHLDRPVLVGHSIAGEELSWVGSVHPEQVSGLIYLDGALGFAYCTNAPDDWVVAMADLWQRLEALRGGASLDEGLAQGMLTSTTQFRDDLQPLTRQLAEMPRGLPTPSPVTLAVMFGEQEFKAIRAPAMAIFACPHSVRSMPGIGTDRAALIREDAARCTAQANAFEQGNPADPVVRIANADHAVFRSNPDVVARAMRDFLGSFGERAQCPWGPGRPVGS
ncbi:MAG TPA: alpha/beta hydrolase [Acidobacteriaceae bacterium]|nr:alpha/beta hydrolase [Acidobacteriaceae bacterium]